MSIIFIITLVVLILITTAKPCHCDDTVYRGCGKILFLMDKRVKVGKGQFLCEDCVKRELELAGLISLSKTKDSDEQPLPNNYTNNSARS